MRTVPDGGDCEGCIWTGSVEIEATSDCPYSENKSYCCFMAFYYIECALAIRVGC